MTLPIINSNIQLIGICGQAHSGKDTVREYLGKRYQKVYGESLADPLKEACARAFGLPLNDFYNPLFKEKKNKYWGVSPREIAQFVGTQMFRNLIPQLIPDSNCGDFWIMKHAGLMEGFLLTDHDCPYEPGDTVIIADVRFQNEYDYIIANHGLIIHLTRPGADGIVGIPNHESEKISDISFHSTKYTWKVINDGTLEDLARKIRNLISLSHLNLKVRPDAIAIEDL